jgi:hypothetical protein
MRRREVREEIDTRMNGNGERRRKSLLKNQHTQERHK